MTSSAVFMGLLGLGASFLPQEALSLVGYRSGGFIVVLVEMIGALYLGFAFLNWMTRGFVIGGIYARPIVLGNLMHFAIVAIVLIKSLNLLQNPAVFGFVTVYTALAVWFGLVLFTHPASGSMANER